MIRARLLGVSRKRGRSIVPSFVRTFVLGFFEVGLPLRCEEDLKESYQPPRAQPASLSSPCLPPSPPPLFVASSVVSSLESAFLPSFLPSILRLPPPLRLKCIFGGREERTSSSSSSQPLLGEWMLCYGSSGNSRLLVNIGHLRSGRNERRESERNERPRPRPRTRPLSITTQSSPSSGPIARWPR